MTTPPALGRAALAALATVVSIGLAVASAAPAEAAPGSGGTPPAGLSFRTAPPSDAVVGGSYAVRVDGTGATTPVELYTQDDSVCSLTRSVVTFVAEGTCLVEAHQDADGTHAAADAAQLVDVQATADAPVAAPTITATRTAATARTSGGWYRTPVTVTFHCTAGSAAVTCPTPVRLSRGGARLVVTRSVVAADGGSATLTVRVSIDRTAPALTVTGVRAGAHYRGAGPRPHCVAHDALSGVARCTMTVTRHGHTVTVRAHASDRAGNATDRVVRYRVHSR